MNVKQKPDDGVKGINSKGRDAFFNSIKKCYPATSTNKESGNTFFALTYNHGKRLVCKISVINRLQFKGHSQNSWLDGIDPFRSPHRAWMKNVTQCKYDHFGPICLPTKFDTVLMTQEKIIALFKYPTFGPSDG